MKPPAVDKHLCVSHAGRVDIKGADSPSVTEEAMTEQPIAANQPVSARALLSHRAFLFFLLSRSLSRF